VTRLSLRSLNPLSKSGFSSSTPSTISFATTFLLGS
jgi:hypothetical protein